MLLEMFTIFSSRITYNIFQWLLQFLQENDTENIYLGKIILKIKQKLKTIEY